MFINFAIIALLKSMSVSYLLPDTPVMKPSPLIIEWVDHVEGDFSFKNKWDYPESVYKNQFGQISCDGICPPEIDRMKDPSGKIYEDSLTAFYRLVDTTHQYHSLKSVNRMYEYSGTDFISFKQLTDGTVRGQSLNNVSTHSSLIITIQKDTCTVWVDYNSIRDMGRHQFPLASGSIQIDRALFSQNMIKATFNFTFTNTIEPNKSLFWKGQIFSKIDKTQ